MEKNEQLISHLLLIFQIVNKNHNVERDSPGLQNASMTDFRSQKTELNSPFHELPKD